MLRGLRDCKIGSRKVVRNCRLSFAKSDVDISEITCAAGHSAIGINLSPIPDENGVFELTAERDPTVEKSNGVAEGVIEGRDSSGGIVFKIPYTAYFGAR